MKTPAELPYQIARSICRQGLVCDELARQIRAELPDFLERLLLVSKIVVVMRDTDMPDDVALSEIQDYLMMAGHEVPLRGVKP